MQRKAMHQNVEDGGDNNPSIDEAREKLWEPALQQGKNEHFDDHSMTCGEKRKMTKSNYFLITFKNEKNSNDDL